MYSVKFKFMVGDTAFDLLTGQEVRIIGTVYTNGRLTNDQNNIRFHEVAYCLDLATPDNARLEEDLEEIE